MSIAIKAHRHYKDLGYEDLPCVHCTWFYEPDNAEEPYQWVVCDHCDWGNQ